MNIPSVAEIKLIRIFKKKIKLVGILAAVEELVVDERSLIAFYATRALAYSSEAERHAVLNVIAASFKDKKNEVKTKYLKYALGLREEYYERSIAIMKSVSAEDLLFAFNYVFLNIKFKGKSSDGKAYPSEILGSQLEHLISTFANTISLIGRMNVPFSGSVTLRNRKSCQIFVQEFSKYVSVHEQIIEVLHNAYLPMDPIDFCSMYDLGKEREKIINYGKFYLQRYPSNWMSVEIYRDLNYSYAYEIESEIERLDLIMRRSKFLREGSDPSVIHFNFAKANDFETDLRFFKVERMLNPIYGDMATKFSYKSKFYQIHQLIRLSRCLWLFAQNQFNECRLKIDKGVAYREKYFSEKILIELLHLPKPDVGLLELFTYDFEYPAQTDPNFSALFKNQKIYYASATQIHSQSYEKVIDKILSRSDVKVLMEAGEQKGHIFEYSLRKLLTDSDYVWGAIKSDQQKKVPEIDGLFLLGDSNLIVYEAKSSIKPETRDDAYSFVENHLVKATNQLVERVAFLRSRADEAKMRLGFEVDDLKITPLVITNHSYFSGHGPITVDGLDIFIVDVTLFRQILVEKTAPSWDYDPQEAVYHRTELKLTSDEEILDALKNSLKFLLRKNRSTVQILESGIIFEISKTPNFS